MLVSNISKESGTEVLKLRNINGASDALRQFLFRKSTIQVAILGLLVVWVGLLRFNSNAVNPKPWLWVESRARKLTLEFLEKEKWHGSASITEVDVRKTSLTPDSWRAAVLVTTDYYGHAPSERRALTAFFEMQPDGSVSEQVTGWLNEDIYSFPFPEKVHWLRKLWWRGTALFEKPPTVNEFKPPDGNDVEKRGRSVHD